MGKTVYNYKFKYFDVLNFSKERLDEIILIDYVPGTHGSYLSTTLSGVVADSITPPKYELGGRAEWINHGKFYPFHQFEDEFFSKLGHLPKVTITINTDEGMLMAVVLALFRTRPPDLIDLEYLTAEQFEELNPDGGRLNFGWGNTIFNSLERPFSRASLRKSLAFGVPAGMRDYYNGAEERLLHNSLSQMPFESFFNFNDFYDNIGRVLCEVKLVNNIEVHRAALQMSYDEFRGKNPFSRVIEESNDIVQRVRDKVMMPIPKLHIVSEALVDMKLKKEFPEIDLGNSDVYYTNTSEIIAKL
jgi:hypothetical protein